jgi:hypothetical protein
MNPRLLHVTSQLLKCQLAYSMASRSQPCPTAQVIPAAKCGSPHLTTALNVAVEGALHFFRLFSRYLFQHLFEIVALRRGTAWVKTWQLDWKAPGHRSITVALLHHYHEIQPDTMQTCTEASLLPL